MGNEFHPIQNAFTSGELSPRMYGRLDLDSYQNALALCSNWKIWEQGGITRRPGLHYVATTKTPANKSRLLRFVFNNAQAYVVEAGNLYFRFYTSNGQLLLAGNPVELVTPFLLADLPLVRYAQRADVMWTAHQKYAPQEMDRTSATSFTMNPITFLDGPYFTEAVTNPNAAVTITPSGTTGSITLTASNATFGKLASGFLPGHVGSIWRIKDSATWGWVLITAVSSTTSATATVQSAVNNGAAGALDGVGATTHFREGAWSAVPGIGYPAYVTLAQQRLFWTNTPAQPDTEWSSNTGDLFNMADSKSDGTTLLDVHGIVATLASEQLAPILWLGSGKSFLLGTGSAEFTEIGASQTTQALTPTNLNILQQTTYGSFNTPPVKQDYTLLFVQRSGRKIRELSYDFASDSYKGPDLSIRSEHLFPPVSPPGVFPATNGQIVELSFQKEPDPTLWLLRGDGILIGMAYDRAEKVVGFFRVVTGPNHPLNNGAGWPTFSNGGQDQIESIVTIPHPNGDRDQTWVQVLRTVNGAQTRYVEYLDDLFNPYPPYFSLNTDACITFSGLLNANLTVGSLGTGTNITAVADQNVFTSGMVGQSLKVNIGNPNDPGVLLITHFTDAQHVLGTIIAGQTFNLLTYQPYAWGVTVSQVSGATHLASTVVDCVLDGSVANQQTIDAGGNLVLPAPAVTVELGLHYDSRATTIRPEVKMQQGTSQGLLKRWAKVVIRVISTLGLTITGPNKSFTELVPSRTFGPVGSAFGQVPPLITTDIIKSNTGWDRDGQITFIQTQPLPASVTLLSGNLEVQTE